jgi:transposase
VECLRQLAAERQVVVALESTGTYGDCFRQAVTDAGLVPQRVSSRAVKDYAETFDGVPSNHDGKDAAMIAELAAFGKFQPWPAVPDSEWQAEVERHVQWLDTQQDILMLWLGRIEALLARHWPELPGLLKLNSATLLRLIAHYGGPRGVVECPEVESRMRRWGRAGLRRSKLQAILAAARSTVGVRMTQETMRMMRDYAREALRARQEIQQTKQALKGCGAQHKPIVAMAEVVGPVTACVLWVALGDPRDFHCGEAYRKAMGLNLKERSSGKYQGKLKITKRGSSLARRWLYFSALRRIQQAPVKAWYLRKKSKDQGRGLGAVVAVMRKLALALYAVTTRGESFDMQRLLPGRPRRPSAASIRSRSAGGLPPDPQDLSHGAEMKVGGGPAGNSRHAPPSFAAPGTALGSVPTVALSSAQVNNR